LARLIPRSQSIAFLQRQVFTGEPLDPDTTAFAVHGDKIVAVGNLPEVVKAVPTNAQRIDPAGKSLFPGFIDSHSHSSEGGINRVSADATMSQLVAFVTRTKKSGKCMNGDFLQISGLPLEFWSDYQGRRQPAHYRYPDLLFEPGSFANSAFPTTSRA
jgi:predicted amidohydrolase YtcJ